jgi:hypothetical protein
MTQTIALQIDNEVQATKSKEGRYLTFAVLKNSPYKKLELDVVGWTEFNVKRDKSTKIAGTVRLWGHEIPVKYIRISPGKGAVKLARTACIIVFEYSEPRKYYLAIVVDAISNVMAIAGKRPETVAIVETKTVNAIGSEEVQFSIVEKNQL